MATILPDILDGEPATWHGSGNVGAGDWKHKVSPLVRRFRAVSGVDDYLYGLRAFIVPAAPAADPVVVSPLGLAAAFDYLNVVWRLRFGDGLLAIPSVERSARLAFDATTVEDFDNRLSALGELFKGFDPPGDDSQGSLQRLRTFLRDTCRRRPWHGSNPPSPRCAAPRTSATPASTSTPRPTPRWRCLRWV